MKWTHRILIPKPDREHIYKTLDGSFPVVLSLARHSRAVINGDFAHLETLNLQERGDEAVHFAIKVNVFKTFFFIYL
jgi:hypothetical protein